MGLLGSKKKKFSIENNQEKRPMTNEELLDYLASIPFEKPKKEIPVNTILFILFLPFWCLYWLFKGLLKDK